VTAATREQATVLALTDVSPRPWFELSELLEQAGSATGLIDRSSQLAAPEERDFAVELAERLAEETVSRWAATIDRTLAAAPDIRLVTVLDDDYPMNLRKVYNRPPFLFTRGSLTDEDARSVAVVGTRQASPRGRDLARQLATGLARRGVTVVSGLAAGIDTEAHAAALEAGGRTIGVMGTGIDRVYPASNVDLASRIPTHGALISQFWPGAPPRASNFPMRNVVTSGIAVGTAVIEASSTSGAKMQARLALEHGKRLFLVRELVMQEEWAKRYAKRRGAVVVESVDDILSVLDAEVVTELQLF
jgi:DNA processing protein